MGLSITLLSLVETERLSFCRLGRPPLRRTIPSYELEKPAVLEVNLSSIRHIVQSFGSLVTFTITKNFPKIPDGQTRRGKLVCSNREEQEVWCGST